jgi:hypothetical protein
MASAAESALGEKERATAIRHFEAVAIAQAWHGRAASAARTLEMAAELGRGAVASSIPAVAMAVTVAMGRQIQESMRAMAESGNNKAVRMNGFMVRTWR